MSVHRNEKLVLQVIFFISECSIYSCQMLHLHPEMQEHFILPQLSQDQTRKKISSIFTAIQYGFEFLYPLLSSHFIAAGPDCFSFSISPLDLSLHTEQLTYPCTFPHLLKLPLQLTQKMASSGIQMILLNLTT